ncbi:response regulator [Fibrella aquatilis]|uniref:Response regulator transcription factor n=1 Tax=Fibrella aquatilis TaxID=2817059 RepID=A0A939K320_9BACT|nr:response regulator transcription factor [Fibrella aquatilis]MBO0934676.1 response regulator transcription factor [Fibrella aquatilis]
MQIKLLIVDDNQMFAEGIWTLLEDTTDYEVLEVLHSGQDVLEFLDHTPADVLLFDIDLPDSSGFEITRLVRRQHPGTQVLAISSQDDRLTIEQMLQAGALGYCLKSDGRDELFSAIQTVAGGKPYLPAAYLAMRQKQKAQAAASPLSGREVDVVRLISEGMTISQISEKLAITERAVETLRKSIYKKVGPQSNIELARFVQKYHPL